MNAKLGHRLNSFSSTSTSPTAPSYLNSIKSGKSKLEDDKVYVKESFVPPEISMINYFLNIVIINSEFFVIVLKFCF